MIWLYCASILLVAAAAAAWAVSLPRLFQLAALPRALLAAALTPFLVGTVTLVAAGVWPRAPALLFAWLPLASATAMLAFRWSAVMWMSRRIRLAIGCAFAARDPLASMLAIAASAGLIYVAYVALAGVRQPIIAHDALIYLNEALVFARNRTLDSIPTFDGQPWDVISGHPHGFLFQSYLAQALLAGHLSEPGFPNDLTARVAFQFTLFFLLAAIAGAAAMFRQMGGIPLALLLTFTVAPIQYISQSSSRDGFRLIPLLALTVVLCAPLIRRFQRRAGWAVLCGVLAGWSISAHALNLIHAPAIGLVVALAYLKRRVAAKTLFAGSLASIALAAFAARSYIGNFLDTGHPLGYGMYYLVYKGTPLAQAFLESGAWDGRSVSIVGGFNDVFQQFGYVVSVLSIVSAVAGILSRRLLRKRRAVYTVFAGCFLAMLVVPLSGLLDFGQINLRGAMLSNFRYPLGSYVLSGIVCAPVILGAIAGTGTRRNPWTVRVPVALATSALAAWSISAWKVRELPTGYWAGMFPRIAVDAARGERWITSDNRLAYYHPGERPIFIYTRPARALLAAESADEVWRILREWRVRTVVLDRHLDGWWPRTTLYRALVDSPLVLAHDHSFLQVFTIVGGRAGFPDGAASAPLPRPEHEQK